MSGADGAHVGPDDTAVADARRLLGPTRWLGASAKSPEAARAAVVDGTDYIGCGACFPSPSKDSSIVGLDGLRTVCAAVSPHTRVVAIGGLTAASAGAAVRAGAAGVAVISAVFGAADVAAAVQAVRVAVADARLGNTGALADGACCRAAKL